MYQEGTTLACGRSFPTENGFRFVGFSIGDSMIGAWSSEKKVWQTLALGRVKVFNHGQEATAIFPTAYHPEEIHPIDVELDSDAILIPFTDGVYDYLPCERVNKKYADGSEYQATVLDAKVMHKLLQDKKADSAEEIITAIAEYSIEKIDAERKAGLTKAKKAEEELATYTQERKKQEKSEGKPEKNKKEQAIENEKLQHLYADKTVQLGDDFTLFGVGLSKNASNTSSAGVSSSAVSSTMSADDDSMLTPRK